MATKMVDRNVHTGEALKSKQNSDEFRSNYDVTFQKKAAPITAAKTCRMQGIRVCCKREDCVHWIKPTDAS